MISKKKLLPVLAVVPLLGAAVVPAATDASVATKNVQIKYNNVKVMYNGVVVPTTVEPFIMNGTTYIPLRMMANVFSKDITWDGATYTIDVKDRPDPRDSRIQTLEAQLKAKDDEIARLKTELANANARANDDDEDIEDLDDMEDYLNDEYGDWKDMELDFTLSGDEDDEIEVEIEIDTDEYEDEWEDIDKDDIEDLVIDIIEDIWDEFDDADVTGEIYDTYEDESVYDFDGYADEGDIELDGKVGDRKSVV